MIKVITAMIGEEQGKLLSQPRYGYEYVAFTELPTTRTWQVKRPCNKFKDNALNAKIHKILTHKYLDGDYFLWIDSTVTLKSNPDELVDMMGDKNFLFFKHPSRDCLRDEIEACRALKRGDTREISEQRKAYSEFLDHPGLIESAVFIRKNNAEANKVMEKWWIEITRYSARDQISWPIVFRNKDYVLLDNFLDGKLFEHNKYKYSK